MLKIKLLKALNGDSIIISYGEEKTYNILIDGGCGKLCYRQLCRYMEDMKKEKNIIYSSQDKFQLHSISS